jgi:NADPH-dependent 2,4-dienoyl-CoA reductase/sulfur reductase-like enzyme
MRIVIIGNGVAGMEAALAVREREPSWEITLISEESDHFFSRTALMWVFSGQMSHRDIEPLERDAYQRLRFQRVRARVTGVDIVGRRVSLAGGAEPLAYDRLLIASGSRARPGPWPGSDARGVGHFVTLQDLDWYEREVHGGVSRGGEPPRPRAHTSASSDDSPYRFREAAAERRSRLARRPAVVGGGLIGIEAVEVALAAGLRPQFFIREEWFWPIALEPREADWISRRMADHGVEVHLEHDLQVLETDSEGNVEAVRTNHGRYESDCVVVAIGVMPNTQWLARSAIELDERGGIVVDEGLRTSAPDVFAAGDCASVRWFDGTRRPEQLWYTARDQGRVAGRGLLGDTPRYDRGTWYNSAKLMDIEYTTAGLVNMNVQGEKNWFFEEQGRVRSTTRVVLQDDRVVGFNMLGRRWDHSVLTRWIEERRSLQWVLGHLNQAAFDTELVPPLVAPRA